jgi:hypothetical protein
VFMAVREAFRAELQEAGPNPMVSDIRLGLTLDDASLKELRDRLQAVMEDFVARPPDPDGKPYGLYLAIHRRRLVDGT